MFFSKFPFFKDSMFSAWNQKPKQPNMPWHNVYSLPSIGRFVVKLAEKRQKTALKFQLRFCEGKFYPIFYLKRFHKGGETYRELKWRNTWGTIYKYF